MTNHLQAQTAIAGEDFRVRQFYTQSRWLSEENCRLDATAYSESAFLARENIQRTPYPKAKIFARAGAIYHPTQNQPRSNFKRIWVDSEEEGVAFVSGRELFFFQPEKAKFLSKRMAKLDELSVREGTILLSRSGTTGHPVLVNRTLSHFAVTDDAIRILPGLTKAGYIYAFLASRFGQILLTKNEYGSTVSHLEAKHVGDISMPLAGEPSEQAIHQKIVQAYGLRDQGNELLEQADQELHHAMGVEPFTEHDIEYIGREGDPKAFAINSGELGVRFDASHHVPIASSAIKKLGLATHPLVALRSIITSVYLPPRVARVYVDAEHGTPFLQGSHVLMMRIHALKSVSNTKQKNLKLWTIKKDEVLLTRSGTVGRVAIVTKKMDGWAASEHMLRVRAKAGKSHPGFLAAFLNTSYGKHQLRSKIYGGVVDELTAEDTEEVLVPEMPYKEQEKIGTLVLKAYELRDAANDLEDSAIAQFEKLIDSPS